MSGLLTSALGSYTRHSYVTLPPPAFPRAFGPLSAKWEGIRRALHSVGWERMSAKRR